MNEKIIKLLRQVGDISTEVMEAKVIPSWDAVDIRKRSRDDKDIEMTSIEVKNLIILLDSLGLTFTFEGTIHAFEPKG